MIAAYLDVTQTFTSPQFFTRLNNVRFAGSFAGADLGTKINAADNDLGSTAGEIWVDQSAGTALSHAVSISANHVLRFIQGGTYTIAATITLAGQGASIIGEPQGSSTGTVFGPVYLKQLSGANLLAMIEATGGGNYVGYVTIDGNQANNPSGLYGLYINSAIFCTIDNTSVHCKSHGIYISSGAWPGIQSRGAKVIRTISLNNVGSGCRIDLTVDCFILQSEFENNNIGLDLVDSANCRITQCDFGGNSTYGLSNTSTISSNGASGFMLVNSQFGNNHQHEIYINGWSGSAISTAGQGNLITGCQFISANSAYKTANTYDAIYIVDSGSNVITGNYINNPNGAVTYKNCVEISQVHGTEGADVITGNLLQGFGTNALVSLGSTWSCGNVNANNVFNPGPAGDAIFGGAVVLESPTPSVGAGQLGLGTTTAATATAGTATLPAKPVGFLEVNIAGTIYKLPYYS